MPPTAPTLFAQYWLPLDISRHGLAIDRLWGQIFWITTSILIAVEAVLLWCIFRYRDRGTSVPSTYTHGNGKLEIALTLLPTILLLWIALQSKRVWDQYRYSRDLTDPNAAHIEVIAQQFNWNFFYAGHDRKLGRYLVYPTFTDAAWPRDARGRAVKFPPDHPVAGPADLPPDQAHRAVDRWIGDPRHAFGKVDDPLTDSAGVDDIAGAPGLLYLPVNRVSVLSITSKDVIHDFYSPNLRINAYAVPGQVIDVAVTPTVTSKSLEQSQIVSLDALPAMLADPATAELVVEIDDTAPGAAKQKTLPASASSSGWRYVDTAGHTILYDGRGLPRDPEIQAAMIDRLRAAGTTRLRIHVPVYFEILCAQLCGEGHTTMEAKVVVLDQTTWSKQFEPAPVSRGRP